MEGYIGSSVIWAEEARKLAVNLRARKRKGGSAVSAQRLRWGFVWNTPRDNLSDN